MPLTDRLARWQETAPADLAHRPDLIALARLGIDTLDTQFLTPHLISMGSIHIPHRDYLARLTDNPDAHRGRWQWQETG